MDTPAVQVLSIDVIVSDPKVRRGRPVIKGTGLTVADIMLTHTTGDRLNVAEIATHYGLNIAQVYAALSYYYFHQEKIDAQIRADRQESERAFADLRRTGRAEKIE